MFYLQKQVFDLLAADLGDMVYWIAINICIIYCCWLNKINSIKFVKFNLIYNADRVQSLQQTSNSLEKLLQIILKLRNKKYKIRLRHNW